ncbi:MAG: SPOR domain-containing protein [Thermoleophilia bacterium]|nr:SPOR domain-containing protein [Thermoleophilia bacterium]
MSTDDLNHDEDSSEPGTIGVGMGGSCPNCRAPVDLGQEFCLECGAPIRFSPRQRTRKRSRSAAAPAAAPSPGKKNGFPWIPFLVVLALVGAGFALTLVDNGGSGSDSSSKSTTDSDLPVITNSRPDTTTESSTITTTLQDCDPTRPLDGTQPAVVDDGSIPSAGGTGGTGEEIPSLTDPSTGGTADDGSSAFGSDVPTIEPGSSSGTSGTSTVTVDQNGNLCDDTATDGSTSTSPIGDASTTDASGSSTDTAAASGDWPAGQDGWTVIVAGYDTETRAQQRAADVQEDGFSDSGVLLSSDFQSLCPGIYVVFSGTFQSESEANSRLKQLQAKPDYAGMYVREVKRNGTRPSGCTTAN